jgi:hypothetical protein
MEPRRVDPGSNLYVRFKGNPPGKGSPEIVGLSSLLNRIASGSAGEAADFRNPNGVYMKLMNFRRFDPIYPIGYQDQLVGWLAGKAEAQLLTLKPRKIEHEQ